ncbi:MAG: ABC transporter permease [Bifidobacteriaceae bacterium]|jgi:ABC-2 type transport system permease protein|nr:ABC transporter permease [Bifidobacteriaceae bacterium]
MNSFVSLARAQGRASLRDPATLFFTFLFPVLLLVVFSRAFGQAAGPDGVLAMQAVGPNVVAFGAAYVGMFTASQSLVEWRASGMSRVLFAAPVRTGGVLAANLAVGLALGLAQAGILVALSVLPGLNMSLSASAWLALPVVTLGIAAFFSIGMVIGALCKTVASAAGAINAVVLPMAYVSGAMLPAELLPDWATAIGRALPMRYMVEAIGGSLTGVAPSSTIGLGAIVLAGVAALFFGGATKIVKWL